MANQRPLDISDLALLALLSGLWAALILLAGPGGGFPLNDGWSFAGSVQNLIQHNRLEIGGWTSMPLLVHLAWGALFCLPCGFSFEALRLSGLVAGWALILSVYLFQRINSAPRPAALLTALVLMVTPLHLPLSLTFMTDVPFAVLLAGAVFCLDRGLKFGSGRALALGLVLAGAATLTRQLGLAVLPAFGVAILFQHGFSRRSAVLAGWGLTATVLPLGLYLFFAAGYLGFPEEYRLVESGLLLGLGEGLLGLRLLKNAAICLTYLGLFLFPLLAWRTAVRWSARPGAERKRYLAEAALFSALLSLPFLIQTTLMPLGRNILVKAGIGPLTLADVHLLGLANYPLLGPSWWALISLFSLAGGALLVMEIGGWIKGLLKGRADLFILTALVYLLALLPAPVLFDRYLLPVTVLILIRPLARWRIEPASCKKALTGLALAHLVFWGFLSLAGSHDYMAWNRARWKALDHLTQELGLSWEEIDGGFEFNGWYGYDRRCKPRPGRSWWWVRDDRYMVAFGPVKGFRVVKEYPFARWLPGGDGRVVILERVKPGEGAP